MRSSARVRPGWLLQAGRLARRKSVLVMVGAAVLVVLLLALTAGPCLRALVERKASELGLNVKVGRARFGWRAVRLNDVEVHVPAVPSVRAAVGALDIRFGYDLSVQAIQAHGGTVRLVGSAEEVSRQIDAWRAPRTVRKTARRHPVEYGVDGVNVVWRGLSDADSTLTLWGLRYAKQANGEPIGADQARLSYRRTTVDARRVSLVLASGSGARRLRSATTGDCRLDVDLDALGSSGPRDPSKPGGNQAAASVAPVSTGERGGAAHNAAGVSRQPASAALVATAAGENPGSWASVRASLKRIPDLTRRTVEPSGRVDFPNVRIRLRHGSEVLNVGPARVRVSHDDGVLAASLEPQSEAANEPAAALRMSVHWPLAGGTIGLDLRGGPLSLAAVGVKEGDFGLRNVRDARVELSTKTALSSDLVELTFSGTGRLIDLALEQPKLAREVIRGLSLDWSGEGRLTLDGREMSVSRAELTVGDVRVWGRGNLVRGGDYFSVALEGGIPLASCDGMLASAPEGLLPLLAGVQMSGTFGVEGSLRFDTRKPRDMHAGWTVNSDCRVAAAPAHILPDRFKTAFSYDAATATGAPVRIVVGPGTATWIPLFAISRYMELAVRLCEDGGFWRHRGFDKGAIKTSLRENLRTGRFVRGASTISMQTAKNLYLRRDKTLSRKLQEVVLTMLLEQELTKEEILELYLNVIEYGPGIYGIGPAAQHYFQSHPSQLTLGQALYLASILPNPRVSHFRADSKLSRGWTGYVHRLMQIAYERKWITEEELTQGLAEEISFGVPGGATQETIRPSGVPTPGGTNEDGLEATVPTPEDWDG